MVEPHGDAGSGRDAPRRYYGKYPGVVTHNDPPEDGSAHRGQVKVQVPGILEETPDGTGHQPIEVLAAPAFLPGFFFVPNEQDPVWVEFVAGDINFPIWTGVWYPDDATPVTTDPSDPGAQGSAPTLDQKLIRTKSGHVIQLDDTQGSEALVIKDETNQNMLTFNSDGITFRDNHQNKLTFDSNGITIQCGDSSKIVVASSTITLQTSGVKVTIDGSAMNVGDP